MNFFLSFKHKQLFLLTVAVGILATLSSVIVEIVSDDRVVLTVADLIHASLYLFIICGWFYTVGTFLHEHLPKPRTMNIGVFKKMLILMVGSLSSTLIYNGVFSPDPVNNVLAKPGWLVGVLILPYIVGYFYCIYFVAKALKLVEARNNYHADSYTNEFILIYFFPIGIWFIQPRINKLYNEKKTHTNE